jgi:hypothetical protein
MTQNAIITVLEIIASNSGGHNSLHSGQVGIEADSFNSDYINLNGSASHDIGQVNSYLMIESTDLVNVILTQAGGSTLTVPCNTLLILSAPFTDVAIINPGTTQVGIKVISS